jgi:predicted flap endonuclease-1-like 5' DNA nuclease
MSKQTQNSMLLVGFISGGVGFMAFLVLLVVGNFDVNQSVFLAIVLAAAVAVFLFVAFHRPADAPLPRQVAPRQVAPKTAPKPASEPATERASVPASDAGVQTSPTSVAPAEAAESEPRAAASTPEAASEPVAEDADKPDTLDAPRGDGPDDLKKIKGVGPKLEQLLNRMGFYHFDQVANWTSREVAWVDENLEGFKGRVSRDDWVAQAKLLADGGETEFSKKVEGGGVY